MDQDKSFPGYSAAHFCLLFITASFSLTMLSYHAPDSLFHALARLDSLIVRTLLSASGLCPVIKGDFVVLDKSCVQLSRECSILFISAPFIAFLLAASLTLKQKVIRALWGITLLTLINSMRIIIILVAGLYSQWLMEYVHMVFSRMIMIMAVIGLSMYQVPSIDMSEGIPYHVRLVGFTMLFITALSALWLAVGTMYSRSVICIVCSLLGLWGYIIHEPVSYSITPMSVDFTGVILFGALSLASVYLGARPGILRFMACLALLMVLQIPAEAIEALYSALHAFHAPWIIGLKQVMENLILPLALWCLLIGKIYGSRIFATGINP